MSISARDLRNLRNSKNRYVLSTFFVSLVVKNFKNSKTILLSLFYHLSKKMQTPLELQIQTLPDNPGVYQYFDKDGKILYVGKAKNLKKRVQSYFTKNHDNYKTSVLVKKIVTIKHIVVPTETDALLL